MSNKELNFKVILASIHPGAIEAKEAIATLLASAFNTSSQQTRSLLEKLPIVLFENLTTNDVKALKDHLIFFSKLGLDFNITPKAIAEIPRANWVPKIALPVITCPTCGEMFYLMRSQDVHQQLHQIAKPSQTPQPSVESPSPAKPTKEQPSTTTKNPPVKTTLPKESATKPSATTKQPTSPSKGVGVSSAKNKGAKSEEDFVSSEMEEIDVLSAELQSIVDMEEKPEKNDNDVEEIEEVGSISSELNDIGNPSEELKKAPLKVPPEKISPSPKATNLPTLKSSPVQNTTKPASTNKPGSEKKNPPDIEEIGGISAEFEEIEGVSAEFERICLEGMDGDIGSLSAEFEEIEGGGISSELEGLKNEEKISEIPQPMKNIAISSNVLDSNKGTQDKELDELQGISQELGEIEDSNVNIPKQQNLKPESKQAKTEVLDGKQLKQEDSGSKAAPKAPIKSPGVVKSAPVSTILEPGNCKVFLTFSGKASKEVIQLLSQTKKISLEQAKSLSETTTPVLAASGISLKSAQNILKQFQILQVQGRISTI